MKKKMVTALLITVMAASVFTGCGNKMEGDGRVQAAMADAESGQNETEESVPEAAAEPTAEPASDEKAVSDVNADNENGETAGTNQAEETSQETETSQEAKGNEVSGYTFDESVAGVMYAKSSVNLRSLPSTDGEKVGRLSGGQEVTVIGKCNETGWYQIQMADESIAYASDSYIVAEKPVAQATSQNNNGGQTTQQGVAQDVPFVSSVQTSTEAELCNSEFIALLNADRAALGLSQISVTSTLDSNALQSAKNISQNYSHDVLITSGATNFNIASGYGSVSSVYDGWKNSPGHWVAMIDANLQYCSVARYGNFWVFIGYASNPIVDGTMTVEQAVNAGIMEDVTTKEEADAGFSVQGTTGAVSNTTPEDDQKAADWGWDF